MKKYLGIDYGAKRIGLAIADSETRVAVPRDVVSDLSEIVKIIEKEEIDEIVLGVPVKMSGERSGLAEDYAKFARSLRQTVKIPVIEVDERLTSKAADALAGDKKTKAPRDALAAMLILQGYLDSAG